MNTKANNVQTAVQAGMVQALDLTEFAKMLTAASDAVKAAWVLGDEAVYTGIASYWMHNLNPEFLRTTYNMLRGPYRSANDAAEYLDLIGRLTLVNGKQDKDGNVAWENNVARQRAYRKGGKLKLSKTMTVDDYAAHLRDLRIPFLTLDATGVPLHDWHGYGKPEAVKPPDRTDLQKLDSGLKAVVKRMENGAFDSNELLDGTVGQSLLLLSTVYAEAQAERQASLAAAKEAREKKLAAQQKRSDAARKAAAKRKQARNNGAAANRKTTATAPPIPTTKAAAKAA